LLVEKSFLICWAIFVSFSEAEITQQINFHIKRNKKMNKITAIENPANFLKNLREKSKKTSQTLQNLHQTMRNTVKDFYSCGETILFCSESLKIRARDYHYGGISIINNIKISVFPWHNNCFERDAYCESRLVISFDMGEKEEWRCELRNQAITIRVEEGRGIFSRGATTIVSSGFHESYCYSHWDEIFIEDFSDFEKLEKLIYQGLTELQIPFKKRKEE
jgi:hypothetical protein